VGVTLPPDVVGTVAGPLVQEIDARWLMAYAAALGDTAPEYLDTARPAGIVGHPLFAVCYEWPLAVDLRARTVPEEVARRSVHATHDLRLHRRARPGDRLSTTATIVSAAPRSPGAYVVVRFETVDADGQPVSTTDYGSIYRGVECASTGPRPSSPPAGEAASPPEWSARVAIALTLAHVYTECARIWNPIHTDRAVAQAAGLPDTILHGTATLALAVSTILEQEGLGPGAELSRIACRFTGMVPLPSAIEVTAWRARQWHGERVIAFQARTPDGRAAIREGRLVVGRPPSGSGESCR
jgi:acyl dehydratase